MGGIFGARYFGDYETAVPATFPPVGTVFRGSSPLGYPQSRQSATAILHGVEARGSCGNFIVTASAQVLLSSARGEFEFGMPTVHGSAAVQIKGVAGRASNEHEHRFSSVTLGQKFVEKSDDEEAALTLFLSQ